METGLPTPMTARVYVNLPEGNSNNYGLWFLLLYLMGFINQLITGAAHIVPYNWGKNQTFYGNWSRRVVKFPGPRPATSMESMVRPMAFPLRGILGPIKPPELG